MEIWLWALSGVLTVVIAALLIKIHLLRKAASEIKNAFADKLTTDTNTLIDISSRDKAMRALADALNHQLRALYKERRRFEQGDLELKNAVAGISHDLRTPLTAIRGYLALLEQEEDKKTVRRYLSIIQNRTEMLTRLTEELFGYSVILSEEAECAREPVAVGDVLEESIAAFYAALKAKQIAPKIEIPKTKVIRTLDRSALSRVFSNLLHNAMRYSDGDLEITLTDTGKITFANTAASLSEVQVGRLFDRFYTVETARNSTGLGLSIAKTLIERMNGSILAQYENGRLCITILLPETENG